MLYFQKINSRFIEYCHGNLSQISFILDEFCPTYSMYFYWQDERPFNRPSYEFITFISQKVHMCNEYRYRLGINKTS